MKDRVSRFGARLEIVLELQALMVSGIRLVKVQLLVSDSESGLENQDLGNSAMDRSYSLDPAPHPHFTNLWVRSDY